MEELREEVSVKESFRNLLNSRLKWVGRVERRETVSEERGGEERGGEERGGEERGGEEREEKRGEEKRGEEKRGEEKRGEEKRGEEKRGEEKRKTGTEMGGLCEENVSGIGRGVDNDSEG